MDEYDEAVLLTLALLESRLSRLEYVLGGQHKQEGDRATTIADRIHKIEKSLQQLAGKTALISQTNDLLNNHREVLKPAEDGDQDGASLDTSQKAALVVERAPGFATVASQLKALDDQQIPCSDGFAKLAVLRPRIAQAEARQLQQALKISELRRRNGLINQRYKHIMLLGVGRCWAEYHDKLAKALQTVVRQEFKLKSDHDGAEAL